MRNAEVEKRACIAFYLYAAFVEFLRALDVSFLEFLCALLQALHSLNFRRVGGRGMRSGGSRAAFEEMSEYPTRRHSADSRFGVLLSDPHGTAIPQRETRQVGLAGGHRRTARLDRGLRAITRSCGAEGVASTRAAVRTDVAVCTSMLIVSAQLWQVLIDKCKHGSCSPRDPARAFFQNFQDCARCSHP